MSEAELSEAPSESVGQAAGGKEGALAVAGHGEGGKARRGLGLRDLEPEAKVQAETEGDEEVLEEWLGCRGVRGKGRTPAVSPCEIHDAGLSVLSGL